MRPAQSAVCMVVLGNALALAVAAAGYHPGSVYEPKLVLTQNFGNNDKSEFSTMRSSGLATEAGLAQVVMMTSSTLLALSLNGTYFYDVPPKLSSPIGLLMYLPEQESTSSFDYCLFVVPYQNSEVFTQVTCSAPFGGTCELETHRSVKLPKVALWRDMGATMDGNEILVFSDTMLVIIQCPHNCECTQVSRYIDYTALAPSAAKFPFLIAALGITNADQVWLFLTTNRTDQRTAAGLMIAASIAGNVPPVSVATLYLLPGAGAVCFYQHANADILAISAIDPVSDMASLFTFYVLANQNLMVINPFPLASPANELFAVNGASTPIGANIQFKDAFPSFVVTESFPDPAVNVYAHVIGSSHLTSQPAVVNGTQFGAMVAVASGSDFTTYVGAFDVKRGANVLLTFNTPVFHGGSSTVIPTSSTSTADDDDDDARAVGARQSQHIEEQLLAYAHGLIGEAELALLMPPEPLTGCTDTTQPPTCLESCSPLPSVICGPTIPPPAGYQCFLMPTQPDACNNCPAQYSSECNSS